MSINHRKLHNLACIFSYPKIDISLTLKRVQNLFSIGVDKFIFVGDTQICNTRVLGKGTNCLVVKCIYRSRDAVVKFLRLDSNRQSLELEAEILKKIEPLDLAPKVFANSDWYIIEEYIPGTSLIDYSSRLHSYSIEDIYTVIRDLLCKTIKLDMVGIDHGELSRPKKHVRITDENLVYFIDFESASMSRAPKNLTSIIQFLLNHDVWRPYLLKFTGINSVDIFYEILRKYKHNRDIQWIQSKLGIDCF